MKINLRTLLLNSDCFTPLDIWTWEDAISKLLCSHTVTPIKFYPEITIRDGSGNLYEVPCVVATKQFVTAHKKLASYGKYNIYARDFYVCQYCGKKTAHGERTLDHVIPRSQYNPKIHHFKLSSFENVVTACRRCNILKGNKTPKQANMTLLKKPTKISREHAYRNKLVLEDIPIEWREYVNNYVV